MKKAKKKRFKLFLSGFFAVLFIGLLAGTAAFYRQAFSYYRQLQRVRLDPAGGRYYAQANREVLESGSSGTQVILFGDSRIAGWNPLPQLENAEIINRGISGQTTAQVLARIEDDVLALKPKVVVLQVGINDLKNITLFPEQKEEIVRDCKENIKEMVHRLNDGGVKVIVLTIFPPGPVPLWRRGVWSEEIGQAVEWVNEELKNMQDYEAVFLDCGNTFFYEDTLHLNRMGYEQLNRCLEPQLEKLLGQ